MVFLVISIQTVDWLTVGNLIYIRKHFYLRGTPLIHVGMALKHACKNLYLCVAWLTNACIAKIVDFL